jgi:hypothetical protein
MLRFKSDVDDWDDLVDITIVILQLYPTGFKRKEFFRMTANN